MLDLVAIAQSTPGAIAVNASILVGWRVAGPVGVAVSVVGTVLPPLVILTVISAFYAAFSTNRLVGPGAEGHAGRGCRGDLRRGAGPGNGGRPAKRIR